MAETNVPTGHDSDNPTDHPTSTLSRAIDVDDTRAEISRARHLIELTDVWMNENAVGNVPPAVDGAWLHHADLMRESLDKLDRLIDGEPAAADAGAHDGEGEEVAPAAIRCRPNVEAETQDCCSAAWMLKEYHYSLAPEERPADYVTWSEHVNRTAWLVDRVAAAAHQLAVAVWGEEIAADRGLVEHGGQS